MNDKCNGCKYVIADVHSRASGCDPYLCTNQDSQNFGKKVGAGCESYEKFKPRPDMPFKDALETLVTMPKGAYPDYWFLFGKEGETSRPFYCISFESNKQMFEYREAMMRCFEELMKLKTDAGDFTEEEHHED